MTSSSDSSLSAGKTSSSTMPAAGVVSTYWNVWSGVLRWKTTVASSGVSTESTEPSSEDTALTGSAIAMLRSMLNFTSDEVRGSPLEKVRPEFSVHVNVFGSVYVHFLAASPWGVVVFGGMVNGVW